MQCDPLLPIVKTVSKLFICFTHEPRIAQHFPEKHYESHKLMKSTLKERIFSSFFFKEIHENNCSVEKRIRGSDTCKILFPFFTKFTCHATRYFNL